MIGSSKVCYSCGRQLTAEIETVEHVPARCLYDGFGETFKRNLITVPCCDNCNLLYSKIDQEIRDVIAVKGRDNDQPMTLIEKGVRSIMRRSSWRERSYTDSEGNVIAVDFNYDDLKKIHIKNFKALFFREYGFPVPGDFDIEIVADGDDDKTISRAKVLHDYAQEDKQFECSGHPDIFKYILKDMTPDEVSDDFYESGNFAKLIGVTGLLIYHEEIEAVVFAVRRDYLGNCRPVESEN